MVINLRSIPFFWTFINDDADPGVITGFAGEEKIRVSDNKRDFQNEYKPRKVLRFPGVTFMSFADSMEIDYVRRRVLPGGRVATKTCTVSYRGREFNLPVPYELFIKEILNAEEPSRNVRDSRSGSPVGERKKEERQTQVGIPATPVESPDHVNDTKGDASAN